MARDQVGSLADMLPGVAGEFDTVADAMADFTTKSEQLGTIVGIRLLPVLTAMVELMNSVDFGNFDWKDPFSSNLRPQDRARAEKRAADMAEDDSLSGRSITEVADAQLAAANEDFWARKEAEKQEAIKKTADKALAEAEKLAEAERKKAEATKETRAAAAEEYRFENAMLAARLKGDADRLAKLEREKAIREEIKRLEGAGFTAAEARKPAEAKVDAEKLASDADAAREAATKSQRKTQEGLAEKVNDSRKRLDDLQYQSTIGSISSMQRIGGGGGAMASGLDYARQAADLQREANGYLRELIAVSRQTVEG
jgi:hypothetical protein